MSGYVPLLEPVNCNDSNLLIKVKLTTAIPASQSYILECHGISKGEYVQFKNDTDQYIAFTAYSVEAQK